MSTPTLVPAQLHDALRCAARCDLAITSEEWLRTFHYEENWSDGVLMAKYDNGAGDHVIVFFTDDGKALIKGFDHESEVSPYARETYGVWPGMYDGMPPELLRLLHDEASEFEHVTFCCWSVDGQSWVSGNARIPDDVDDGSTWLLSMISLNAEEFTEWAKDYYGEKFDLIGESGIAAVFNSSH